LRFVGAFEPVKSRYDTFSEVADTARILNIPALVIIFAILGESTGQVVCFTNFKEKYTEKEIPKHFTTQV